MGPPYPCTPAEATAGPCPTMLSLLGGGSGVAGWDSTALWSIFQGDSAGGRVQ